MGLTRSSTEGERQRERETGQKRRKDGRMRPWKTWGRRRGRSEKDKEREGAKKEKAEGEERAGFLNKNKCKEERKRGGRALSTGFLGYGRSQGTFQTHLNFGEDSPFKLSACSQSNTCVNKELESSTDNHRTSCKWSVLPSRSFINVDINWAGTDQSQIQSVDQRLRMQRSDLTQEEKRRADTGALWILVSDSRADAAPWLHTVVMLSLLAAFPPYLSGLKG